LKEFRQRKGHCNVPHAYEDNMPLARWVKRQRYQYKLLQDGTHSTLTSDRVKALDEIGFIWDSQRAAWEERLSELEDYHKAFSHCNVPAYFRENPQVGSSLRLCCLMPCVGGSKEHLLNF